MNEEIIYGKPTKEEIYQWYVVEDGAYLDAPKHFNITMWEFEKRCRAFGIKKDRKKTCLKSVATREAKAGGKEAYNKQLKEVRNRNAVEKYGSAEAINQKRSQTLKETWRKNHDDILSRVYAKKRSHNTFNASNPEENYYFYLIDKYGENDVIRQYVDDRYPFNCDFYIKSLDLFIELNLHWTHGGKLFTGSKEDLLLLEHWKEKAKTSKFYQAAIEIWTQKDVEKYNYIKRNKLNFKIFYNSKELYE